MRTKVLIGVAVLGIVASVVSVMVYNKKVRPQTPLKVTSNPYEKGVYASGIVESAQPHGVNIAISPEVSGTVVHIAVQSGQTVAKGEVLFTIDDTVQRRTVEQLKAQSTAALEALRRMKAEPRKETLDVAFAQMEYAKAVVEDKREQLAKLLKAAELNVKAVSRDDLDKARHALQIAQRSYDVAQKQYQLVKAGSWDYEVRHQEAQYLAAQKAYEAAAKLLEKYTVRAPTEGTVLLVQASVGSYVSPQGAYDPHTRSYGPVVVMGSGGDQLQIRCYVDEILIPQMPAPDRLVATMFLRGSTQGIPLSYVRVDPYVIPKIQLASGRTERVDVRVLPVIFRFTKPDTLAIYPGQLVDVYIGEKQ